MNRARVFQVTAPSGEFVWVYRCNECNWIERVINGLIESIKGERPWHSQPDALLAAQKHLLDTHIELCVAC